MRPIATLFVFSLVCLLASPVQAQDPLELELVRAPRRLDTVSVAVVAVYDLRDDTTSIGEAQTGLTNKTRPVQLKGGAAAELQRFLQTRLPEREGARPVAIGLDFLLVSEQRTTFQEIARAEIGLRFFEARGDSLGFLTSTRGYTERPDGMDVTQWHDENVRGVLVDAVVQAAADGALAREATEWRTLAQLREGTGVAALRPGTAPDSLGLTPPVEREASPAPSTYAPPGSTTAQRAAATTEAMRSMRQFLTVGLLSGDVARGGTLTYGAWNPTGGDWIVPFSANLTVLSVDDPERGVEGAFFHSGGAVSVVRRLNASGFGLQGSLQAILGSETFEGSDDTSYFAGGRAGVGLAYFPVDTGVVANAGLFGSRLFGSELYPSDVGFTVNVGYQF